jgi:hypothetical protein
MDDYISDSELIIDCLTDATRFAVMAELRKSVGRLLGRDNRGKNAAEDNAECFLQAERLKVIVREIEERYE